MTDPNALVISQGVLLLVGGIVSTLIGCIVFLHRQLMAGKDQQIAQWRELFLSEQTINVGKDVVIAQALASGSMALDLARTSSP